MDAGDRFVTYAIAGLGSRCVAALFDFVLSLLLMLPPFILIILPLGFPMWMAIISGMLMMLGVQVALCWACEVMFDGQSPGKNICGLRVVSLQGHAAGFGQIAVRNLMRLMDFLPAMYLAGLLSAFITAHNRTLGDLAAGTVVIHDPGLAAQLESARVPSSVYSTSEDGYLLESFLLREEQLKDPYRTILAQHLARHLAERYPTAASAVPGALLTSAPSEFLRRLHEAAQGRAE